MLASVAATPTTVRVHGCHRSIADSAGVLGNSGDDIAGGSQLLAVLASILGVSDGLEAVTGEYSGFWEQPGL